MNTQAPPTQRHAKPATPKQILPFIACLALCSIFSLPGLAAEVQAESTGQQNTQPVNPSGTWTWTTPLGKGIPERTHVLTLKLDSDSLTGSLASPGATRSGNPTPITAAKVEYDTISFTVTRQSGANTVIQNFSGVLTNDTIKGNIAFEVGGKTNSAPWTAKRQIENSTTDPLGPTKATAGPANGHSWQSFRPPRRAAQGPLPAAGTNSDHNK